MIRKLGEPDRQALLRLAMEAPQSNLYILGNLETLGFDSAYCEFWGDQPMPGVGVLRGILNRYMEGWSVYGRADANWRGLGQIVDRHTAGAKRLQDNPGGVTSFLPYLNAYAVLRSNTQELMELQERDLCGADAPLGSRIRRAGQTDLDALIDFYADAEQMTRTYEAVRRPLIDTRVWVAEVGGQIRAAALTNAEAAGFAMIGGVFTQPEWRGRGLNTAVCHALCKELLQLGKRPVLYWTTPAAGAVYRRLGFRKIGDWRSIWLQPVR